MEAPGVEAQNVIASHGRKILNHEGHKGHEGKQERKGHSHSCPDLKEKTLIKFDYQFLCVLGVLCGSAFRWVRA
jgi:hypothetical protein